MITIIPIVMEYTTMTAKKTETEIKITTIMRVTIKIPRKKNSKQTKRLR